MREIKFRGWDKEEKKIVRLTLPKESIEWMQFTGLHDKNGKQIYELDQVTWQGSSYFVVFYNGEWILLDDRMPWDCPSLYNVHTDNNIEIINNYFETKNITSAERDFIENYLKD